MSWFCNITNKALIFHIRVVLLLTYLLIYGIRSFVTLVKCRICIDYKFDDCLTSAFDKTPPPCQLLSAFDNPRLGWRHLWTIPYLIKCRAWNAFDYIQHLNLIITFHNRRNGHNSELQRAPRSQYKRYSSLVWGEWQ